jgi:hypothetical protein
MFFAFLVCLIAILFPDRVSPQPAPVSVPVDTFSSGRAMRHVRQIAAVTHPAGSVDGARVAAYIASELSALGLHVELQKATVVTPPEDGEIVAARVQNVFARKPGVHSTGAVLFVAHYDSAVTSPGASDDGAAVAALLETARALTTTPALRNDICFLFTDAEERGLFGARAFQGYPALQAVKAVLNFESRGTSGPSILFETGRNSGWLVRQFIEASPNAFGNSAAPAIYELLPNDTDFSVFRDTGLPGLNFAFIEDWPKYHTALDSIANLDERSLQHHGLYATALARRLGDADLTHLPATNLVFWNLIGPWIVSYSSGWVLPLAFLLALVFLGTAVAGLGRGRLTIRGLAIAAAAPPVAVMLATGFCKLYLDAMVGGIDEGFLLYRSGPYHWAFACLAASAVVMLFLFVVPRVGVYNTWMSVLLWWTLLALITSWRMPGLSYVFVWPALLNVAACYVTMRESKPNAIRGLAPACAAVALAAMILVPMVKMLGTALVLSGSYISGAFIALCLLLPVPQIAAMLGSRKWLLPGLLILGVLVGSWFVRRVPLNDSAHPKHDRIVYSLNADSGHARWIASQTGSDQWVEDILGRGARTGDVSEFLPDWYSAGFPPRDRVLSATAPKLEIPLPSIEVREEPAGDQRVVNLKVKSERHAARLAVRLEAPRGVAILSVDGQHLTEAIAKASTIQFVGPGDEGLQIELKVSPDRVSVQLLDYTYDLPAAARNLEPRPPYMIPTMSRGDGTLVYRSLKF